MEQQIITDIGKTIRFTVIPDEYTVDVLWISKHMADMADYLHSIDAEPEEEVVPYDWKDYVWVNNYKGIL